MGAPNALLETVGVAEGWTQGGLYATVRKLSVGRELGYVLDLFRCSIVGSSNKLPGLRRGDLERLINIHRTKIETYHGGAQGAGGSPESQSQQKEEHPSEGDVIFEAFRQYRALHEWRGASQCSMEMLVCTQNSIHQPCGHALYLIIVLSTLAQPDRWTPHDPTWHAAGYKVLVVPTRLCDIRL